MSLVLHPRNPYAPTVHLNVRHFVARTPAQRRSRRSGGSAAAWTSRRSTASTRTRATSTATCRDALAPFGDELYPRFKRACDAYFFLKHRHEPRGIGGIFFDDLDEGGLGRASRLTRSVGDHFLAAYAPILERRRDTAFGERERDFQAYRRGRYVEFNLVWDRGTLFGLQSNGRDRGDPAVDAAARALALRLGARARARPRRALHRFPPGDGTGLRTSGARERRPPIRVPPGTTATPARARRDTRISGEQVYAGALLDVRRDRVRLPDGGEAVREYVVHPGAVLVVPVLDDGRLVVERQFRYPLNRVFLEFPAGKIDPGETRARHGAARADRGNRLRRRALDAARRHPSGHLVFDRGDRDLRRRAG